MKISTNQLYHGAAIIQIAEHDKFTAINSLTIGSKTYENAYRINNDIAIYLKYSTNPKPPYDEYIFNFKTEHLHHLRCISKNCKSTYLTLVCVKDREICCISYSDFYKLINSRKEAKGETEEQYTLLITAPQEKGLHVYINEPNVKGQMIGKPVVIPRNSFPDSIFG